MTKIYQATVLQDGKWVAWQGWIEGKSQLRTIHPDGESIITMSELERKIIETERSLAKLITIKRVMEQIQ